MSLINDALKRARQAQQQVPPPLSPGLQFRPVEPAQQPKRGAGLILPVALAAGALLVFFLVWHWLQNIGPTPGAQAKSQTAVAPGRAPTGQNVSSAARDVHVVAVETHSAPAPAPVTGAPKAAATTPPASLPAPVDIAQPITTTNPPAVIEAAAPKPAPLRLQGIVFQPAHPSAMISGKTLFIGDKLGELRVVAIDPQSATLIGSGQTNVLTLPQ